MADYWFDRGTSGTLINLLAQLPPVDTTAIESETYESSMFDLPFESYEDPLPAITKGGRNDVQSLPAHRCFICPLA